MSSDPAINLKSSQRLDLKVPGHIGVIMDGNGRWATARGRPRNEGHLAGVKALRRLVELCIRYGVQYVTVFSFSSENWSRPRDEISFIFGLLRRFVASDLESLINNNVRVRIIGERAGLQPDIAQIIEDAEAKTRHNDKLNLIIAFNYGGQDEIARAARRIAADVASGKIVPESVNPDMFGAYLDTAAWPAPDLLIRTSSEYRLSNFMLWQAAYTELVFTDTLWPDFDKRALESAIAEYNKRERRFGGTEAVAT